MSGTVDPADDALPPSYPFRGHALFLRFAEFSVVFTGHRSAHRATQQKRASLDTCAPSRLCSSLHRFRVASPLPVPAFPPRTTTLDPITRLHLLAHLFFTTPQERRPVLLPVRAQAHTHIRTLLALTGLPFLHSLPFQPPEHRLCHDVASHLCPSPLLSVGSVLFSTPSWLRHTQSHRRSSPPPSLPRPSLSHSLARSLPPPFRNSACRHTLCL